jgi:hypothetical protein
MTKGWTSVNDVLPENGQRVLCWVPANRVYLPGADGSFEERPVVILRFSKDHFLHNPSKTGYQGSPHFWLGEGTSNRFFQDVEYWMALPPQP